MGTLPFMLAKGDYAIFIDDSWHLDSPRCNEGHPTVPLKDSPRDNDALDELQAYSSELHGSPPSHGTMALDMELVPRGNSSSLCLPAMPVGRVVDAHIFPKKLCGLINPFGHQTMCSTSPTWLNHPFLQVAFFSNHQYSWPQTTMAHFSHVVEKYIIFSGFPNHSSNPHSLLVG